MLPSVTIAPRRSGIRPAVHSAPFLVLYPTAVNRPWSSLYARFSSGALCKMFIIGQPSQDWTSAEIRQSLALAQQRTEHFGVEEAGPVQQGKDEVDCGISEQNFEIFRDDEVQPHVLEDVAHLSVVERMVAIFGVDVPLPERILGNEEDAQPFLGLGSDCQRR